MTPQEARNEYQRQYRKNMTPEQRRREREYNSEWRKKHPEAVRASQIRYWKRIIEQQNLAQTLEKGMVCT